MADELPARNPDGTFRAEETPQIDTFRLQLLRQAEEMGLAFSEVKDLDNATMQGMLNAMLRQQIAHQKQLMAPPQEPKKPSIDLFGINPETGQPFTEADFAPSIVHAFRTQGETIAQLKERLDAAEKTNKQQRFLAAAAMLDDIFSDFPEELHFLSGGTESMQQLHDSHSTGEQFRLSAMLRAGVTVETINQSNYRRSEKLILAAARELAAPYLRAANPYDQPAPRQEIDYSRRQDNGYPRLPISKDEWEDAAVATPTYRPNPQLPSGPEKAEQNIARKQRGATERLTDDEIMKTLLSNGQPPRRG